MMEQPNITRIYSGPKSLGPVQLDVTILDHHLFGILEIMCFDEEFRVESQRLYAKSARVEDEILDSSIKLDKADRNDKVAHYVLSHLVVLTRLSSPKTLEVSIVASSGAEGDDDSSVEATCIACRKPEFLQPADSPYFTLM